MKRQTSAVMESISDPNRQRSQQTLVIRTLLEAEQLGDWLALSEIGEYAGLPASSAGSRIRDLRLQGFVIKRSKRFARGAGPLVWVYKLFTPPATA